MKKVLIFSVLAFIAISFKANAQIQQGNVLVGGNFTNISLGLDNSKVFSFDLTPKAAWFVQDNIALGGYLNLGIQTAHNTSTTTIMVLVHWAGTIQVRMWKYYATDGFLEKQL